MGIDEENVSSDQQKALILLETNMKKFIFCFVVLSIFFTTKNLKAQNYSSANKTYRVAIFAPLYLDSAFTGYQLRSQNSIPKITIAGADFIQGAQIALDTIKL